MRYSINLLIEITDPADFDKLCTLARAQRESVSVIASRLLSDSLQSEQLTTGQICRAEQGREVQ